MKLLQLSIIFEAVGDDDYGVGMEVANNRPN